MKLCSKILALTALASTAGLISCAGPAGYSYQNVSLKLTFNPICSGVCVNAGVFVAVPPPTNPGDAVGTVGAIEMPTGTGSGSCVQLTATVTNAPANISWTIIPTATPSQPGTGTGTAFPVGQPTPNVGYMQYATGANNYYCVPGSVPIFSGATLAQAQAVGLNQGEVMVVASVPADPNNPSKVVTATQAMTYQVTSPPAGVTVGVTPTTIPVPLGTTYQFSGYIVGINGYIASATPGGPSTPAKAQTWFVNGVAGGNATTGTITNTGLFTAPKAYPSSGKTVTVTMGSTAYPTLVTGASGQGAATTVTFP